MKLISLDIIRDGGTGVITVSDNEVEKVFYVHTMNPMREAYTGITLGYNSNIQPSHNEIRDVLDAIMNNDPETEFMKYHNTYARDLSFLKAVVMECRARNINI